MHWLWSMDSSQLWASLLSNNFAKYVIASLLMTGLNPFLALGLSQKWQNKRVWKMLLQCNSSMGWHRAIVNVIDLHLRSFQLNWRRQRKSSWTPSRLTNLDPFSILQFKQHLLCGFARCANKFWLNKEKKCWCLNRGNKCLFYLSDPKTEIGNSFDMTFSGMTFFNNCLLDEGKEQTHLYGQAADRYQYTNEDCMCCCKQKASKLRRDDLWKSLPCKRPWATKIANSSTTYLCIGKMFLCYTEN